MTTPILHLLRSYVAALDAKKYSTAHQALTLLADAVRSMPAIEPETHVRRELGDGASYDISIHDEFIRFVTVDVTGDDTMRHYEPAAARALIEDLERVLAAMPQPAQVTTTIARGE